MSSEIVVEEHEMLDRFGFDWSAAGEVDWSVVEREIEERNMEESKMEESKMEERRESGEESVLWACPNCSDPFGGEIVALVREESGVWVCPRCGCVSWSPRDDAAWEVSEEELSSEE